MLVSGALLMVRSVHLRDCQIAGSSLEPLLPPSHGNIVMCTRVTTSGMVKTLKIGLSAAKSYLFIIKNLWMQFTD